MTILFRYQPSGNAFLFSEGFQIKELAFHILNVDRPTYSGNFTYCFETLVDYENVLWFCTLPDKFFLILAPSHYVPAEPWKNHLQIIAQYNEETASVREGYFCFLDPYQAMDENGHPDLLSEQAHAGRFYSRFFFNSTPSHPFTVELDYENSEGPFTLIYYDTKPNPHELFRKTERKPSPYIRPIKKADLIDFKYLNDPYTGSKNTFLRNLEGSFCPLCDQERAFLSAIDGEEGPYCARCFKSGKVHRHEPYITALSCDREPNIPLTRELKKELARTPLFLSNQDPVWKTCCNDCCQFIKRCGKDDLIDADPAIKQTVKDYFGEDSDNWVNILVTDEGGPTGYLFRCLHCEKYHFHYDTT